MFQDYLAGGQERILAMSLFQRRWMIAFTFTEQPCRMCLVGSTGSLLGVTICHSDSGAEETVLGI